MRQSTPTETTAADAVAGAATHLREAGIERPREEAEALVAAVSGRSREALLLHPEASLAAGHLIRLEDLLARRAAREPLPYVLEEAEFYSLPLLITRSAIVPRPETEILVDAGLERARAAQVRLALDVGAGCGAIAVALARHLPDAQVVATDISQQALSLARENCARHQVGRRVRLICTDLLSGIRLQANCITANLPYIRTDDFPNLQPEVRDFEPRLGLDGGPDGLRLIRRLAVQLLAHLAPQGFAALEVGAGQAPQVANLLSQAGLSHIEVLPDLAGIERVVIGRRQG
jgi:release factor glutamine methyltransferase